MSNLGLYLWQIKATKKVGGTLQAIGIVLVSGAVIALTVEAIIRKLAKKKELDSVFTFNEDVIDDAGVLFRAGERFRAFRVNEELCLIQTIGDGKYQFVRCDYIGSVSNCSMA